MNSSNKLKMNIVGIFDKLFHAFEIVVVVILATSLMAIVSYATLICLEILWSVIVNRPESVMEETAEVTEQGTEVLESLKAGLYRMFGSFLMILLGLVLVNSVRVYLVSNSIKIESILMIAVIATARHLTQLDFHHTNPLTVFAVGFVVFVLVLGYFMMTKLRFKE